MVSKISISALLIAAFAYAACLVMLKRKLPDPRGASGMKRRFILAVLLFAGMLMNSGCRELGMTTCYDMAYEVDNKTINSMDVSYTLSAAWKVLDAGKGEEFRNRLEECVKNRNMDENVSKMLDLAYKDLSHHRMMTRSKGEVPTCYKPTVLEAELQRSNETSLKQIELLRAAREKGAIDEETATKVVATLSKELQFLADASAVSSSGFEEQNKFLEKYRKEGIAVGVTAVDTAKIIVEFEKE